MGVCSNRDSKSSTKTKVCQLDCSLVINEEILRFQVTMEDTFGMAECYPFKHLIRVALGWEK